MDTPLTANSLTAGSLLSSGTFRVPQFQREYSWEDEEVGEFFLDLSRSLGDETYFLGLVIVTGNSFPKDIVDGQQRLMTLTLLAAAIHQEAIRYERNALADRISTNFLRAFDFDSDAEVPRISASYKPDAEALNSILSGDLAKPSNARGANSENSNRLRIAYSKIVENLRENLSPDPFSQLGTWADFISNRLYFALFEHPDPSAAFRVFEIINTRGKELTTADLLKSYVLSNTPTNVRKDRYNQWQAFSESFADEGPSAFVQFIRHVVTVENGHVQPKDLYDRLAGNHRGIEATPPAELIAKLENHLPLYRQITDPTLDGPASTDQLGIFAMLNAMNVISVRPMLLAIAQTERADQGMRQLLKLVVQRIVVGNLGTGNVERRLGNAAHNISAHLDWSAEMRELDDLRPAPSEFANRMAERSMNRSVLGALRASILQNTVTPKLDGYTYLIRPRSSDWDIEDEDRAPFWVSTIGNTFIASESRRPMGSSTWEGFKRLLLPSAASYEMVDNLESRDEWTVDDIAAVGNSLGNRAADLWYGN